MAFIEASLKELPVSANLGQSCLATKISAPGPSSFGWFHHKDETLAAPGDADSFSTFSIDMWRKLELLDEVDKLSPPIFFDHQYFSVCGCNLRVSDLLAWYLD